MIASLREAARALGGEVVAGVQIVCPGPGHSRKDRSLSVRLSATAPDGFLAFSHAGDDWQVCRDYVRGRLGLAPYAWKMKDKPRPALRIVPKAAHDHVDKIRDALQLWDESSDPRGTIAETYLSSRQLELGEDIAGSVLRWNARIGAMVALFRSIEGDDPRAVSRIFLDRDGRKIERKFLGQVGGAAIKLDADDTVTRGLHIGEGVETCLAARQLGLRPTWALGSASAIAAFPVLAGVECITLLAEHDDASTRAVEACATRWYLAGREVLVDKPVVAGAKDLNDALRGAK
jgi:putative DNA primase/helicase